MLVWKFPFYGYVDVIFFLNKLSSQIQDKPLTSNKNDIFWPMAHENAEISLTLNVVYTKKPHNNKLSVEKLLKLSSTFYNRARFLTEKKCCFLFNFS